MHNGPAGRTNHVFDYINKGKPAMSKKKQQEVENYLVIMFGQNESGNLMEFNL